MKFRLRYGKITQKEKCFKKGFVFFGGNMNKEQFARLSGELRRQLDLTRLLLLDENSTLLELINSGIIPAFEDGGELKKRSEKTTFSGKGTSVRRPFLVAYNKALRCNCLYAMTGGHTSQDIDDRLLYDNIPTPVSLYGYVDRDKTISSTLSRDTHTKDNISVVQIGRVMPVAGEIFDYSNIVQTGDYTRYNEEDITPLRGFMSYFYGNKNSAITAIEAGGAQDWYFDHSEKARGKNPHKMSRPTVMYLALFINYAHYMLNSCSNQDYEELENLKNVLVGVTKTYLAYTRYSEQLKALKAKDETLFKLFMQVKHEVVTDRSDSMHNEKLNIAIQECIYNPRYATKVKELLLNEFKIDNDLRVATTAIMVYFTRINSFINMSDIGMSTTMFETLSNIAKTNSDAEYQRLAKAWIDRVDGNFTERIEFLRQNEIREEQERLRLEKEKRLKRMHAERIRQSKVDATKNAVMQAIEVYNHLYKTSFQNAINGSLLNKRILSDAREFRKLFVTYEDGTKLNLTNLVKESLDSENQERLKDSILDMSPFYNLISTTYRAITSNDMAIAVQDYLSGEAKRIEGDEGEDVERALDLIKIVHDEFEKAEKMQSIRIHEERTPVEIIIEKALRDSGTFQRVDLSEGTSARAYLDEMLMVTNYHDQIMTVVGTFKKRLYALWSMQSIRKNYEVIYEDFIKHSKGINGEFSGEIKRICAIEPVDSFATVCEEEILKILNDNSVSYTETIDNILAYEQSKISQFKRMQASLVGFLQSFDQTVTLFNSYYENYNKIYGKVAGGMQAEDEEECEESIPNQVSRIKLERGIAEGDGIIDGYLVGMPQVSGESASEDRKKIRNLTDGSLMQLVFSRAIPNVEDLTKKIYRQLESANDIFELERIFKSFSQEIREWSDAFPIGFERVIKLYNDLLDKKAIFDSLLERQTQFYTDYINGFTSIASEPSRPLLTASQLDAFKTTSFAVIEEYSRELARNYDSYRHSWARGLVESIQNLEARKSPSEKIEDYVNIGRVNRGINILVGHKISKSGEQEDVLKNIIAWIDDLDENLIESTAITQDESLSFIDHLQNPAFQSLMHIIDSVLHFEISIAYENSSTGLQLVQDAEGQHGELNRIRDTQRALNILGGIHMGGITFKEPAYKHLIQRIHLLEDIARKAEALARFQGVTNYSGRGIYSGSSARFDNAIYTTLNVGNASQVFENEQIETRAMLNAWIRVIHLLDRDRKKQKQEVILEGRSLEREKGILEGVSLLSLPEVSKFIRGDDE